MGMAHKWGRGGRGVVQDFFDRNKYVVVMKSKFA